MDLSPIFIFTALETHFNQLNKHEESLKAYWTNVAETRSKNKLSLND